MDMGPTARITQAFTLAFALAMTAPAVATGQEPGAAGPSCSEYLEGLRSKIEDNYAGYRLEVRGARRAAYDDLVRTSRRDAERREPTACFDVLKTFVTWFSDPHLFIFQSTRIDSAEAAARRSQVQRRAISESRFRTDLADRLARPDRREQPDPIEGIWTDGSLRVAVRAVASDSFEIVVLTPDSSSWEPGDVRGAAVRTGSEYTVTLLHRNYARRVLDASIHRHVLLRLSPEMWAREYPVAPSDSAMVDLADPRRPTIVVRGTTAVVSMPSHSPAYRAVLDSLIARHAPALGNSRHLIVDLRGNEGGSSFTSNRLLPYLLSADELPERYPERGGGPMMLSSPDQIRYASRSFGSDTTRFVRTLLERLEASPGELVPLREPGQEWPRPPQDSLVYGPERVAIMVDGSTVSAAEVLVLRALRSRRVTVFGMATGGALDYQSTHIVPLVPEARRWYLGYPTITRDSLLPEGGMRGRGIAPHVEVDWALVPDPIGFVDSALAAAGAERARP